MILASGLNLINITTQSQHELPTLQGKRKLHQSEIAPEDSTQHWLTMCVLVKISCLHTCSSLLLMTGRCIVHRCISGPEEEIKKILIYCLDRIKFRLISNLNKTLAFNIREVMVFKKFFKQLDESPGQTSYSVKQTSTEKWVDALTFSSTCFAIFFTYSLQVGSPGS